jgi:hypothetical protein
MTNDLTNKGQKTKTTTTTTTKLMITFNVIRYARLLSKKHKDIIIKQKSLLAVDHRLQRAIYKVNLILPAITYHMKY